MGTRKLKEPLGSIDNARLYLAGLWTSWLPEHQRLFQACGEVAVMMLAAVDEHAAYLKRWNAISDMADKMRELDPVISKHFLLDACGYLGLMGAFPEASQAAELILQDPLSVAHDNLFFALLNDICDLAKSAKKDRTSVFANIVAYTWFVSTPTANENPTANELKMPSSRQLAALSVVHKIEDPSADGHEAAFARWKTARYAALKKVKEIGIPFPDGRQAGRPDEY